MRARSLTRGRARLAMGPAVARLDADGSVSVATRTFLATLSKPATDEGWELVESVGVNRLVPPAGSGDRAVLVFGDPSVEVRLPDDR